jgi:hypothetical protein
MITDVSVDRAALILGIKEWTSGPVDGSTMLLRKVEKKIYQTMRRPIPEDCDRHSLFSVQGLVTESYPEADEFMSTISRPEIHFNIIMSYMPNGQTFSSHQAFQTKYTIHFALLLLGSTVTNQNLVHEEINSRWNSGNAFYRSLQNFLSSSLLSKTVKIKIYKIIILSVVLYGSETWSLTLTEEHRLRVFENRVLRRIFRPMTGEILGGWRKVRNEELHNAYSSPSIIRTIKSRKMRWVGMRWIGNVARMGAKRNA